MKLKETLEREVSKHLTTHAFNAICSIYLEFSNEKIPFNANHLQYLQLASNDKIVSPFFKISLPIVFGLQFEKSPLKINYEYNRSEVRKSDSIQPNKNINIDEQKNWFNFLEIYYDNIHTNSSVTETFKERFEDFWKNPKIRFNNAIKG